MTAASALTVRDFMQDRHLLGRTFGGDSWAAWRTLLAGFDGLPLFEDEEEVFRSLTGLAEPSGPYSELWAIAGRRGGKSIAAALLAVMAAVLFDRQDLLAPGEVATVFVLAKDRGQARTVFRYIRGLLDECPMLRAMVTNRTTETIELDNRTAIEVGTASFRSARSYTFLAVICDEVAYWYDDGANPAEEILAAVRPGLATLGGRLIVLSSPYARRGVLWETYRRDHGQPGPVLVVKAPTQALNPSFPQHVIDRAMERDEPRARAEYLAEFRSDVETFVSREVVRACVVEGRRELPPVSGTRYQAFVDPSGGSSDSFTLAIGHREGDRRVIDAIRETRPPFNPSGVVSEYAELLKRYGISELTGDRYAAEWPREQFRAHGITYRPADKDRSALYRELLPVLNSGTAELLDHKRLINQVVGLERRTSRAGKDRIDHGPGGHDDVANAVAGLLALLETRRQKSTFRVISVGLNDSDINHALFGDAGPEASEMADEPLDEDAGECDVLWI